MIQVDCNVESETISRNFSHTITLKSVGLLALQRDLSPMHDFVVSYIGYIENIVSLIYTIGMLHCIIFLKITFVNISTDLFGKVSKDPDAGRRMVSDTIFPKF